MTGPSQIVENAQCVTKHALHRLFLSVRGRGSDEELSRVMVLGYDLGREVLGSVSPDCDPAVVKGAVDEIAARAQHFVDSGGIDGLRPDLRERLSTIAGPALLPVAALGYLVAFFERDYR